MKNTNISDNLKSLSEEDLINEVLYLIYKLKDDPRYSVISELIYILGKDDLFKLCSVLGGCEIKVPTILELKLFIGAIYIYFSMNTENKTFEEAFKELNLDSSLKKLIYSICIGFDKLNDN